MRQGCWLSKVRSALGYTDVCKSANLPIMCRNWYSVQLFSLDISHHGHNSRWHSQLVHPWDAGAWHQRQEVRHTFFIHEGGFVSTSSSWRRNRDDEGFGLFAVAPEHDSIRIHGRALVYLHSQSQSVPPSQRSVTNIELEPALVPHRASTLIWLLTCSQ